MKNQLGRIHPGVAARLPKLSTAIELGQLVKMCCTWCRTTHHYYPQDLMTLLGDVPFLNIEMNFRCSKCGKREYMKADLQLLAARQQVGLKVRKLIEVKTVRRPVWKDVKL